jgi:hypothetical protein
MRRKRIDLNQSVAWEMGDDVPVKSSDFGFDILPTYVSTQDLYDYLDRTRDQIDAVGRDVNVNSGVISNSFRNNWSDFTNRWHLFYLRERNTGHFWFIGSVMDNTDKFVEELRQQQVILNSELKAHQITPVAPGVIEDKNSPYATNVPAQKTQDTIKTVAIAAAVIAGGILILKLIEFIPKPTPKRIRQ